MPPLIGQVFVAAQESLARDEAGNLYVAHELYMDDVAIYNEHFQRAPLRPIGLYDILVEAFDPDGAFVGARLFGGPGVDEPASMTVHDGRVLSAGSSRLIKYDPAVSPNRTMEWDLLVTGGRLTDTTDDVYQTI